MKLYEKSAVELSEMLKNKQCSSVEITTDVFAKIKEVDGDIGAYITLTEESALKTAAEVDAKLAKGEKLGALAGIPIAVKDNICVKGVLTTAASKMLANFVPPYDATVIEKIEAAGMVITGKTNLDEFAMGSSTESSFYGQTKNPLDHGRVPGGSSGGSAASVKSGQAIMALGSDTGGSIRQPSAFCGTVGLKPTFGSVSRFGGVAFGSSFDQIGPIARTVADTAMLYTALAGWDNRDVTTVKHEYPNFFEGIKADVKGLKVGIPKEYFGPGVDEDVRKAVMETVADLEKMGAQVKEVSLPLSKYALQIYYILSSVEGASNLAKFDGVRFGYRAENYTGLNDMYDRSRGEGFGHEVKKRILFGTFAVTSGAYDEYFNRAAVLREKMRAEYAEVFKQCDVLITPTAPSVAYEIGEKVEDKEKMYAGDICTVPVNLVGVPAISIPCGIGAHGMPVGLQIIGPKFSEQTLFNTALAVENMRPELFGVAK